MGREKGRRGPQGASAAGAAARLGAASGGGGFGGFGGFGGGAAGGGGGEETTAGAGAGAGAVPQEVALRLKALGKRDSTTRTKALAALKAAFGSAAAAELGACMAAWLPVSKRVGLDNAHLVRLAAVEASEALAVRLGKGVAPHLKALVPAWWLAMHDPSKEVALAARRLYGAVFPGDRQAKVLERLQKPILDKVLADLAAPAEAFSDPKVDPPEEVADRYDRVTVTALATAGALCAAVAELKTGEVPEGVGELLADPALVQKKLSSASAPVRLGAQALVCVLLQTFPDVVERHIAGLAGAVVHALAEKDPSCHGSTFSMVISVFSRVEGAWRHVHLRKQFWPKMNTLAKQCFYGSGQPSYRLVLPLLATLPAAEEGLLKDLVLFLKSVWNGIVADEQWRADGGAALAESVAFFAGTGAAKLGTDGEHAEGGVPAARRTLVGEVIGGSVLASAFHPAKNATGLACEVFGQSVLYFDAAAAKGTGGAADAIALMCDALVAEVAAGLRAVETDGPVADADGRRLAFVAAVAQRVWEPASPGTRAALLAKVVHPVLSPCSARLLETPSGDHPAADAAVAGVVRDVVRTCGLDALRYREPSVEAEDVAADEAAKLIRCGFAGSAAGWSLMLVCTAALDGEKQAQAWADCCQALRADAVAGARLARTVGVLEAAQAHGGQFLRTQAADDLAVECCRAAEPLYGAAGSLQVLGPLLTLLKDGTPWLSAAALQTVASTVGQALGADGPEAAPECDPATRARMLTIAAHLLVGMRVPDALTPELPGLLAAMLRGYWGEAAGLLGPVEGVEDAVEAADLAQELREAAVAEAEEGAFGILYPIFGPLGLIGEALGDASAEGRAVVTQAVGETFHAFLLTLEDGDEGEVGAAGGLGAAVLAAEAIGNFATAAGGGSESEMIGAFLAPREGWCAWSLVDGEAGTERGRTPTPIMLRFVEGLVLLFGLARTFQGRPWLLAEVCCAAGDSGRDVLAGAFAAAAEAPGFAGVLEGIDALGAVRLLWASALRRAKALPAAAGPGTHVKAARFLLDLLRPSAGAMAGLHAAVVEPAVGTAPDEAGAAPVATTAAQLLVRPFPPLVPFAPAEAWAAAGAAAGATAAALPPGPLHRSVVALGEGLLAAGSGAAEVKRHLATGAEGPLAALRASAARLELLCVLVRAVPPSGLAPEALHDLRAMLAALLSLHVEAAASIATAVATVARLELEDDAVGAARRGAVEAALRPGAAAVLHLGAVCVERCGPLLQRAHLDDLSRRVKAALAAAALHVEALVERKVEAAAEAEVVRLDEGFGTGSPCVAALRALAALGAHELLDPGALGAEVDDFLRTLLGLGVLAALGAADVHCEAAYDLNGLWGFAGRVLGMEVGGRPVVPDAAVEAALEAVDLWAGETRVGAADALLALFFGPATEEGAAPPGLVSRAAAALLVRPAGLARLAPADHTWADCPAADGAAAGPGAAGGAAVLRDKAGVPGRLVAELRQLEAESAGMRCRALAAWALLLARLEMFVVSRELAASGAATRRHLAACVREAGVFPAAMALVVRLLPLEQTKAADEALGEAGPLRAALARAGLPAGEAAATGVARSVYSVVLQTLPASARGWFHGVNNRRLQLGLEAYTSKFESRKLFDSEMASLDVREGPAAAPAGGGGGDGLIVKASAAGKEVVAVYRMDDAELEMAIKIPAGFPLQPLEPQVRRRMGLPESTLRKWILSMTTFLRFQDGTIGEAIQVWKENLEKTFQGVEECPICYSVIQTVDRTLPKITCRTCKQRYHSRCLYTWFNTSHKSSCPMCRSPM